MSDDFEVLALGQRVISRDDNVEGTIIEIKDQDEPMYLVLWDDSETPDLFSGDDLELVP